jgi:hypothetical protein
MENWQWDGPGFAAWECFSEDQLHSPKKTDKANY